MQPAQPAYFDADFEFSELEVDGCDFLSTLNVQVSSSTTNSLSSSASPPPGPAWTKFHSDHSSAKFFRPKRYLPQSFSAAIDHLCGLSASPVILEVGSGAGAALFPLLKSLPASTSAVAIDIAPTAIDLLRSQPKFDASLIAAHVCDICVDDLPTPPNTIDVAFLVFCLSAVPPSTFLSTLIKIRNVLKPDGMICFRDYGLYDMTMLRFKPFQHVVDFTFRRGDGTLSSFFELEATKALFVEAGFDLVEAKYALVKNVNKKTGQCMRRCFTSVVAKVKPPQNC
ncbi:hypothetical protein TrCOL_g8207 [Triparma columacea]|uniref:Methyltransferase domain-containing protein n=1 Tax=Triparma columacea TaxID=722753 RepID=A0A9W7GAJ0_9STRA|nr:hypothetical protein TrCOL_g8207 [Triparma columacea]